MDEWHDEHDNFIEKWKRSHSAVDAVSFHLRSGGWSTIQGPVRYARSRDDSHRLSDSGDLVALKPGREPKMKRIEVKNLRRPFSGVDDWPFEYRNEKRFIVNSVASHDSKDHVPDIYVAVDPSLTSAGWLHVEPSRDNWYVRRIYVKELDRYVPFYFTPMEHVSFNRLTTPQNIKGQ
tara:strand:+ start:51 stop:581 length:531 start_codon:yes stop_codon:yes gene_type:complete